MNIRGFVSRAAACIIAIAQAKYGLAQSAGVRAMLDSEVHRQHTASAFADLPLSATTWSYGSGESAVVPQLRYHWLAVSGRYHWGHTATVGQVGTVTRVLRSPEDWDFLSRAAHWFPESDSAAESACAELLTLFGSPGPLKPVLRFVVVRSTTDLNRVPAWDRDTLTRVVRMPEVQRASNAVTVRMWVIEMMETNEYECDFEPARPFGFSLLRSLEGIGFAV